MKMVNGNPMRKCKMSFSTRRRRTKVRQLAMLMKSVLAFSLSHIGLCTLIIIYTLLGSILFRAAEAPFEKDLRASVQNFRRETINRLWKLTYEYGVLYEDDWINKITKEVFDFKQSLVKSIRMGYDGRDHSENVQWSYSGSFLYSLSVITTIGYGNIVCRTYFGKAVTIVYAIIGIPLMLLFLTNIGDLMAKSFRLLYRKAHKVKMELAVREKRKKADKLRKTQMANGFKVVKRKRRTTSCETRKSTKPKRTRSAGDGYRFRSLQSFFTSQNRRRSLPDNAAVNRISINSAWSKRSAANSLVGVLLSPMHSLINIDNMRIEALIQRYEFEEFIMRQMMEIKLERLLVPLWLILLTMLAYLSIGAVLFAIWERWDLLDSFYFCFVSLTIIGFGDLFPGASIRDDNETQEKLIITSLYLLIGMALIAMCFNLAQEQVVRKVVRWIFRFGLWKSDSYNSLYE